MRLLPVLLLLCAAPLWAAITTVTVTDSPTRTGIGQRVVLLATISATGPGVPRYRYEVRDAAGELAYVRDWTTGRSTWWTPTVAGAYSVRVLVKEGEGGVPSEATLTHTVQRPLSGVSLTASVPAVTGVGTPITTTATPTGGVTVQYRHLIGYRRNPAVHVEWDQSRPWGESPSMTFTPRATGVYNLRVYARERGSTRYFDVSSRDVVIQVRPALSDFTISCTPAAQAEVDAWVTMSVGSVVGGGTLEWEFAVIHNGLTTQTVRAYWTRPTAYWCPVRPGAYTIRVRAREVGSDDADGLMERTMPFTVPVPFYAEVPGLVAWWSADNGVQVGDAGRVTAWTSRKLVDRHGNPILYGGSALPQITFTPAAGQPGIYGPQPKSPKLVTSAPKLALSKTDPTYGTDEQVWPTGKPALLFDKSFDYWDATGVPISGVPSYEPGCGIIADLSSLINFSTSDYTIVFVGRGRNHRSDLVPGRPAWSMPSAIQETMFSIGNGTTTYAGYMASFYRFGCGPFLGQLHGGGSQTDPDNPWMAVYGVSGGSTTTPCQFFITPQSYGDMHNVQNTRPTNATGKLLIGRCDLFRAGPWALRDHRISEILVFRRRITANDYNKMTYRHYGDIDPDGFNGKYGVSFPTE